MHEHNEDCTYQLKEEQASPYLVVNDLESAVVVAIGHQAHHADQAEDDHVTREYFLQSVVNFAGDCHVLGQDPDVKCQQHKHVGEPVNVFLVVAQGVILEPLAVWVIIVTQLTFYLNAKDVYSRTKDLSKEDNQFNENPDLCVSNPIISVLHRLAGVSVSLVINGVDNSRQVEEHLYRIKNLERKTVFGIVLGSRSKNLENSKEYIYGMSNSKQVDGVNVFLHHFLIAFEI